MGVLAVRSFYVLRRILLFPNLQAKWTLTVYSGANCAIAAVAVATTMFRPITAYFP